MMGRPLKRTDKFTKMRKRTFLKFLQETGLLQEAARAVGVTPNTIRVHRKKDKEFEAAYQESMQTFYELLEAEAYRRAVTGLEDPVFYKGAIVGHRNLYSDRMLELLLKRHISGFRDKHQVDMNVSGGVLVVPGSKESTAEWEARCKKKDKKGSA